MKTNKFLERFKNNIGNYLVWYLLIILVLSFVIYHLIEKDLTDKTHYQNIDLRIVSINSDCSLSDDKFHKPQLCNTILLETINEPHLYCEINTCDKTRGIHIDTE